jgi:hypothetical protein
MDAGLDTDVPFGSWVRRILNGGKTMFRTRFSRVGVAALAVAAAIAFTGSSGGPEAAVS